MLFDQAEYNVRCEWGREGASALAPVSDVVIVVDVLSFSTAVEIAASRGALVYPYRFKDETARAFAASVGAEVADGKNEAGYSLSPASLLGVRAGLHLVLPSPNGAEVSLATGRTPTLAGCFRNGRAVAAAALRLGSHVAVIPAGERWPAGALRPCFEDLAGAGAIIRHLKGTLSPEARAALAAFESARADLLDCLRGVGSGKEKIARGEAEDVRLAAALDVSDCAPALGDGAFRLGDGALAGAQGSVALGGDGPE
jgi:2-phosphosulfolactate phosphatase